MPADAALLGEHRHLCQGLGHHTEEEVMAELDGPRQLAVAHIGGARAEQVQVGTDLLEGRPRS